MRKPNDGEDLIFAVIEHHRALSKRYDMAVNLYNDREGSALQEESAEFVDEACTALLDFCDGPLVHLEPTTHAGIVALLQYIRTLETWQTPRGDPLYDSVDARPGWFAEFCQTLERAVTRMDAPPR